MTSPQLDPTLVLVPPMDLNHGMPGIDKISPFPMKLRTRRGVGLFRTRREEGEFIRAHQGVDLLAPVGTPVFPSGSGKVIGASATNRLILHDSGLTFLTFYNRMQNLAVDIGEPVNPGQRIGDVGEGDVPHLHFELRYPADRAAPTRPGSLAIDPTNALYQWEVRTFQNEPEAGHVIENVKITSLEEIWRGRLLRFLMMNVSGSSRDLLLPLIDPSPANWGLVDTLKLTFFHNKSCRIVWRESLFFSEIQSTYERVAVIAEIKVLN